MRKSVQQICAFAFGVVFLTVMLAIALLEPNPTPFQYLVFRTTLALAAGGVVAMIPGFLQAQVGNAVRAGGAVSAFVVIFFFSPAALVATPKPLKEHVGFLSGLIDHFQRHVSVGEYELRVESRSDVDVGRFWISETSDETWRGLFRKICQRYEKCLSCDVGERSATLSLRGDLQEGVTTEGAETLNCKA